MLSLDFNFFELAKPWIRREWVNLLIWYFHLLALSSFEKWSKHVVDNKFGLNLRSCTFLTFEKCFTCECMCWCGWLVGLTVLGVCVPCRLKDVFYNTCVLMFMYYTVCYFPCIFYAVIRQISMLFINNKDCVFCNFFE